MSLRISFRQSWEQPDMVDLQVGMVIALKADDETRKLIETDEFIYFKDFCFVITKVGDMYAEARDDGHHNLQSFSRHDLSNYECIFTGHPLHGQCTEADVNYSLARDL